MPSEGIATVFVGSAEYYANIDPRVDGSQLKVGCRVLVNEAYAVVGNLGHSPSGPVAKVGDLLPEGPVADRPSARYPRGGRGARRGVG